MGTGENLDEWAWKKDKKGKGKQNEKLGAQKGHEKLIEDAQKKYKKMKGSAYKKVLQKEKKKND